MPCHASGGAPRAATPRILEPWLRDLVVECGRSVKQGTELPAATGEGQHQALLVLTASRLEDQAWVPSRVQSECGGQRGRKGRGSDHFEVVRGRPGIDSKLHV